MADLRRTASQEEYSSESESRPQASTPGAKRRPSRAGTRSVTTLTAAQLERKRANDREAQRAIRQRTKDHIEQLERRIAELTSDHDTSTRLMEAMQRNEELEQENAVLRSRLNQAVAALGVAEHRDMTSEGAMLTSGPSSTDRMQHLNPPRPSSTSTGRSMPSVSTQHPNVSQTEAWTSHNSYTSAASTTEGPHSSHSDLPPPPPQPHDMRWSPHAHPVVAPAPNVESSLHHTHHAEASMPHPASYGYFVDPSGRPISYPHGSQQMAYAPSPNPPQPPQAYRTQSISAQAQSPTIYPSFPSHHTYMAPSQHPVSMMPRGSIDNQQMMYNMPPNMKQEP